MKVTWLFEQYLFDEYEKELVNAINSNPNSKCILYDYQNDSDYLVDFERKLPMDSPVIFHGSLGLGRRVESKTPYYPGIYLTLDNYECYKYYGHYGDKLLNSNYMMMGLNDVLRHKDKIIKKFGHENLGGNVFQEGKVFIRPSNGFKSFTGQLISTDNFEQDLDVLMKSYGGLDDDILVLLSPARQLEEEYRFIVVDGEVVSGSKYFDKDNRESFHAYYDKECDDKGAFDFAKSLVDIYQPDKAFNMDIVKLPSSEYKLMEINSFCCGSLYGNNLDKVVEAVNNLSIKDFNDVYN